MGTTFRDADEIDALGVAWYLKIEKRLDEYAGAFFGVNARGEPVHFLYNGVKVLNRFMWREQDIGPAACRLLVRSLLSVCPVRPSLVLCQQSELSEELFDGPMDGIFVATLRCGEQTAVDWHPRAPDRGTPVSRLFERLAAGGLLNEPFTRASMGIAEMINRKAKGALDSGGA